MPRHRIVMPLLLVLAAAAAGASVAGSAAAQRGHRHGAPLRRSSPWISGTPRVGGVLRGHPGRWSGASTLTYRWQRCNARGAGCRQIGGPRHRTSSAANYKLTTADVGHRMRLVVTAANRWGHRTAFSRLTANITARRPSKPAPGLGVAVGTRQSVAFWLAWVSSMSESQIPWNAVTQVNLFGLQTTAGPGLDTTSLGVNTMNVPQWVGVVHQHHRLAMITIGGIDDQHWSTACDDANRSGFVTNLLKYMVSNGFDGVDLDIEQGDWGSMRAPVAAWDTCVQAITRAAHATKTRAGATPILSTDVDQTWMAEDVAGFASYPDQFNLMGYQSNCDTSCMSSQIQTMLTTGKVPSRSKMTIGMDVDEGDTGMMVSSAQCGEIASYASSAGIGGVMVWTLQGDSQRNHGQFPCFGAIAPYVAPAR